MKKYNYEVALIYNENTLTWATGDTVQELEDNIRWLAKYHGWGMEKLEIHGRRWAGREVKNEER